MPRFILLGGSFNPIHLGHLAFAEALARLDDVSQILAIPAARNPFKDDTHLLPPAVRWEMVRLAFADMPKVAALDLELRRPAPSYTIDTVCELRTRFPAARFDIALGWDAFQELKKWQSVERLLALAGLLVVPRAGVSDGSRVRAEALACLPARWAHGLSASAPGEWRDAEGRIVLSLLPFDLPEVSATRIWSERNWDQVPLAAREVLMRHLEAAARRPHP